MYLFLLPWKFSKMKTKELLCPLAKYQILQRPIWTKSRRGVLDCAKSLPIGTQVSLIVWFFETHVIVWMEWTHQPDRSSSTCFAFLCLALRCLEHATPLLTLHRRRMTSTGKEAETHNGTSIFFWPFSLQMYESQDPKAWSCFFNIFYCLELLQNVVGGQQGVLNVTSRK